MSLIKDGPNIPEEVYHALRSDNLVFFCGAGISKQNGLPLFEELVEQVCEKLDIFIDREPLLKEAKEEKKYDHILDLVEGKSFSVPKADLRKKIIEILNGDRNTSVIHKALLDLSALPSNKGYRLVTTNIDNLFHKAGLSPKLSDIGPKLAPPRNQKWKNLTFLHGLIDKENDPEGEELILTRTDFGLAYLYDNWAARFVIQLFQEFTVLFIGYSIDDPVMNYLISAISSENRRKNDENKKSNQNQILQNNINKTQYSMYAFVGYKKDEEKKKEEKWKSIGIKPILYKIKIKINKNNKAVDDHSLLYNEIKEWAKLKNIGLSGRKQWLQQKLKCTNGGLKFKYTDSDKETVKSVTSFLKTDEKLIKYFPKINPHISWLQPFSELNIGEPTQNENNTTAHSQYKPKLLDTLVKPNFLIRSGDTLKIPETDSLIWKESLSLLEDNIALWLCKNLNKKELIHWVIKHNCVLHPILKKYIQLQIKRLEKIQKNSNHTNTTQQNNNELNLNEKECLFWITVSGSKYNPVNNDRFILYALVTDLNKEYCYVKGQQLIELLEPYIGFEKPLYHKELSESDKTYTAKIKINTNEYPPKLKNEDILLKYAEDFSDLLKKAMQKAEQFKIIRDGEDPFYIYRPSIKEHQQNGNYYPWTYLIDLARDSFDLAMKKDESLAYFLLYKWQQYPYSLFYRLILYAVTKYNNLDEQIVINLFKNRNNVLWSPTCQNELLKYLKERHHSTQTSKELELLIMQGSSRSLFKKDKDIDDKLVEELKERDTYQRLNNLKTSGVQFLEKTEIYCNKVQSKYSFSDLPEKDDRADFPFWHDIDIERRDIKRYHTWTSEQIYNDIKYTKPNTYHDVRNKSKDFQSLSTDIPDKAFKTLSKFSGQDLHSTPYWDAFFTGISFINNIPQRQKYLLQSFKKIENYNDKFIKQFLDALTYSLEFDAYLLHKNDKDNFKKWWLRLWQLNIKKNEKSRNSDVAMNALNLNSGKLSKCIFHILWTKYPDSIPKNDKIPKNIKDYFTIIIKDAKKSPFVLYHFGIYLYILWHLDKDWILNNIQPLISWNKSMILCKSIWIGYLHNPKSNQDFLSDFKKELLELFSNRNQLHKQAPNNASNPYSENIAGIFFLTTGGSWSKNIFTKHEITQIKREQIVDIDILESISWQIWKSLKDAKEKSDKLWSEKFQPWIIEFWPRQTNRNTSNTIAQNLSLAILYCGDELPNAFNCLKPHIQDRIQLNSDITFHIKEYDAQLKYIYNFPKELSALLNWNFPEQPIPSFIKDELQKILDKIKSKNPEVEKDENYKQLIEKLD